jgi:hypothetical protein
MPGHSAGSTELLTGADPRKLEAGGRLELQVPAQASQGRLPGEHGAAEGRDIPGGDDRALRWDTDDPKSRRNRSDKWRRASPAPADGRNNRNLRAIRYSRPKAARVADVFVADKHVDMWPDLTLFGHQAVPNAGTPVPQVLESGGHGGWGLLDYDLVVSIGKTTQRSWYQKSNRHR